jgi:small subunit ribosomal protein S16
MAVSLRLQRFGAKKSPFYRIVATDSRVKRDGAFLELLGTYDPMKAPAEIRLKTERIDYWLSVGAQPSETVASLIRRQRREAATPAKAG